MSALIIALLCAISFLNAADTVMHDQAYFTTKVRNSELIYTQTELDVAQEAAKVETLLQPLYEKSYGYVMDEPLHVGLLSSYNQVANGFSTQYPNNRQINYIGGALQPDYFSVISWLNTLLYHESAHNYQHNAKASIVSRSLHGVLGNGTLLLFPWFNVPNILESPFMAEGNAVLNESWHGNGGRLYSGRFKAATLMQAKAGYLTPERVYNDNLYFLYGSHHYTLGGYYHYYLATHYGLDALNRYWWEHSKAWYWPLFTNAAMTRAIGEDFDTTFEAWRLAMQEEAGHVIEPEGTLIATSQFFSPLNGDEAQIYFLINESGRERPGLIVLDKATRKFSRQKGRWKQGKVVKYAKARYATQASGRDNPWRIWIGLYDESATLIKGTQSQVIEGYLNDGRAVVFDVAHSYDRPQLYAGAEYVGSTNSSVYVAPNNDLYYFKQEAHKRHTLYKNRTPLVSLQGFYGHVTGVDSKGDIYVIANSCYGSSLYRYDGKKFSRASRADTLFDARLIDDTHALVAAMGSDAYEYRIVTLETQDEAPYEVTLFMEKESYYRSADTALHTVQTPPIDTKNAYASLREMHYSGTDVMLGVSSITGLVYSLNAAFADPLVQNRLGLHVSRNVDATTLGGIAYENSQFFINFAFGAYGVIDRKESKEDERDYALIASASLPFLQKGYWVAALDASYYQDYENRNREPFSISAPLGYSEQHGVSMYPEASLGLTPYGVFERADAIYGGSFQLSHVLKGENYVAFDAQYSYSNTPHYGESRGVKVAPFLAFEGDPSAIVLKAINDTAYVKSAYKAGVELKTVLNSALYSFTFPLSLRREALFTKYHYYALEPFALPDTFYDVEEFSAGMVLSTLLVHSVTLPITLEYSYTDDKGRNFTEPYSFRIGFGMNF